MKKLLAMVLALVMTLSLAVSANAFTDDSKVNDNYAEAVAVLNGMGVFKGYEDGSFKPEGDITRAEVATIVYRIYTADVAKNDKSGLYASYNKFSDMAGASWAAGYIGYCANAELVKGYPDGTFKPSGKVTGYEVLAMILRAVGYDKNGEFSGADWALHVAQTAQQAHVLDNVKGVDLNAAATRELVAELLFRGIQAPTVTYTPAFGYVTDKVIGKIDTTSIGSKNFDLKDAATADEWGRPGTVWTYNTGDKETTVIDKPIVSYTTATTECKVAEDYGFSKTKEFATYTNGLVNADKDILDAKDTKNTIGAQGRLTEVYKDRIVYIDTLLAKVMNVADATFDPAGHLKTASSITLNIYDTNTTTIGDVESPLVNKYTYTKVTDTNGSTNYDYTKGQYVLVYAVQYTTGRVRTNTDQYIEIVGAADSKVGAQTVIWYNVAQHTVDGTVYNDNNRFHLDQAAADTGTYTWFFDSYGNLIGDVLVASAYTYGVVTNLYWFNEKGSGAAYADITYMDGTTAKDVKVASVDMWDKDANKYVEDCTPISAQNDANKIAMTVVTTADGSTVAIASWAKNNETTEKYTFVNNDLFQISTLADGSVALDAVKELQNANITTGKSLISGAAGKDSTDTKLYTNDSTKYLVRSETTTGYAYNVVDGFNKIGSYTSGDAVVDYIVGTDGFVVYAFVTGTPDADQYSKLVYVETANYSRYVDGAKNIHYVINAVSIDGQATKIDTTDYTNVVLPLISNVGKVFYVGYTAEYATSATEITATRVSKGLDVSAAYGANMVAMKMDGAYVSDGVLCSNNGQVKVNLDGSETYYGDLANSASRVVYILVNKVTTKVTAVYVSDIAVDAAATKVVEIKTKDDANVSLYSESKVVAEDGSYITNVALVNKSSWTAQGDDTYTVTVTATSGATWTVENVKTEGNFMTFDLEAPATVTDGDVLTISWAKK